MDCSSCSSSEQVFHIAGFLHGGINDSDWLHEEIWGFANALPEQACSRSDAIRYETRSDATHDAIREEAYWDANGDEACWDANHDELWSIDTMDHNTLEHVGFPLVVRKSAEGNEQVVHGKKIQ